MRDWGGGLDQKGMVKLVQLTRRVLTTRLRRGKMIRCTRECVGTVVPESSNCGIGKCLGSVRIRILSSNETKGIAPVVSSSVCLRRKSATGSF